MDGSTPLDDPQHERFAQLMAEGKLNQTDAYIQSGFTGKRRSATTGASVLQTNPNFQKRKQYLQQQAAERALATPTMVVEVLVKEMLGLGPDTTSGARIKAAELVGKYLGIFTEKTHQNNDVTITFYDETNDG
jgi:hypothetical protein